MKTLKNFKQFGSRIVENQLELPFDDHGLISIRKSLLNKLVGCFHEAYDIAHDLNIHEFEEGDQWLEEFKKWVDTNFPQTERDLPIESFFGTAPTDSMVKAKFMITFSLKFRRFLHRDSTSEVIGSEVEEGPYFGQTLFTIIPTIHVKKS